MSWAFQFLGPFFPKLPFYLYCYLHSYAAVPFKKKKSHAAVTVEHHKEWSGPTRNMGVCKSLSFEQATQEASSKTGGFQTEGDL